LISNRERTGQKGTALKNIFFAFCSLMIVNTAFGMKQPEEITIINNTSSPVTIDFGWVFYKQQDSLDTYARQIDAGKQQTFKLHTMNFADYPLIKTKSSTQSIQLPIPGEKELPFGEILTLTQANKNPTATNQAGKKIGQLVPYKKRHQ
jgi:hypothetical protein